MNNLLTNNFLSDTLPIALGAATPAALMVLAMLLTRLPTLSVARLWRIFKALSAVALACALLNGVIQTDVPAFHPWLLMSTVGSVLAVLVQLLCTVIAGFSSRYLDTEPGQRRYLTALAGVLAAVHLLLLADHWLVLIAAWALVGVVLQHLLCFYPERPFALLAAHKKRVADRVADVLLLAAAALAWAEVGNGSLSALWAHIAQHGVSASLQACAVCLVLAVTLRTALLPVHGWLIQVMEAPTPVSALLHAGVVNLGGFVLIRFAPLLEQSMPARTLLVGLGLASAVLAGLVMLTRISIKVRLAWSTTAQMGFMVLECGLGLYTLAALHLVGHSLYKAHAFLSASTVVRATRLHALQGPAQAAPWSQWLAPWLAVPAVLAVQTLAQSVVQGSWGSPAWPWWWSAVLGMAWAPLLWLPAPQRGLRAVVLHAGVGLFLVAGLTAATLLAHAVPLGIQDLPDTGLGLITLAGMVALYLCLVLLQQRPQLLRGWRRWSYAGFYVDEIYTRLALWVWPMRWTPEAALANVPKPLA